MPALQATVVINRPDGPETLPLASPPNDHHVLESSVAPAEPHEFSAELILRAGDRTECLPFTMQEQAGDHR